MQYLIFLMYYVTSQIVNTPTDAFEQSQKLKNKKKGWKHKTNLIWSFIFSNLESTPSFNSEALHIRACASLKIILEQLQINNRRHYIMSLFIQKMLIQITEVICIFSYSKSEVFTGIYALTGRYMDSFNT